MTKRKGPTITIDVKFLQPGDIICSVVDDAFQVTIERPSLTRGGAHYQREYIADRRTGHPRMVEKLCTCSIGKDHRKADAELSEERKAEQERRRKEREEAAWLR